MPKDHSTDIQAFMKQLSCAKKSVIIPSWFKIQKWKRKITQFKRQLKSTPAPRVLTVHGDNKIKWWQRTKTNAWLHWQGEK